MRQSAFVLATALALVSSVTFARHHFSDHIAVSLGKAKIVVADDRPVTTVTQTTTIVNTPVSDHQHSLQWIGMSAGMPLPAGIVAGGKEGNPPTTLFICRANYNGGAHPGKLFNGYCNFGWGGQEITASNYEVLVSNKPLGWVTASTGYVPPNAVQGGYQQNGPLYICQAKYMGGKYPGKVVGTNCNIGYAGQEVLVPFYKVLVA